MAEDQDQEQPSSRTEESQDQKEVKIIIGGKEVEPNKAEAAISLYNALADPETAEELVRTLASRAGLLDKKGDVKDDVTPKAAEGRIHKALKAKLGKEYEKFSDLVGPTLDEAIQDYLKETMSTVSRETTQGRWNNDVEKFMDNHELTEEVETKMKDLMEDAPPNIGKRGFDAQKYLDRMWKLAHDELEIEVPKSRGKSARRKSGDDEVVDAQGIVSRPAPKGITLDDAIDAAMKGVRLVRKS